MSSGGVPLESIVAQETPRERIGRFRSLRRDGQEQEKEADSHGLANDDLSLPKGTHLFSLPIPKWSLPQQFASEELAAASAVQLLYCWKSLYLK